MAAEAEPVAVPPSVTAPLGVDKLPAVIPYEELIAAAEAGRVNAAVVDTANYWVAAVDDKGTLVAAVVPRPDPGDFADDAETALPGPFGLADALREDGVAVLRPAGLLIEAPSAAARLIGALAFPVGFLLIIVAVLVVLRIVRGPGSGPSLRGRKGGNAHGKIRKNAKVEPPPVRFGDVAGCDEVVEELQEVVVFLREPGRFRRVGAKMPKGVILHGPPGTGKTLLAKAVAGEAGVPFYALSGSDFVDTYVGVGASRVRDLFGDGAGRGGGRHHLLRRDRRHRPRPRRGRHRRRVRARGHPEPAAGRAGRLRPPRPHRRDRRDQPGRHARPGAHAARAASTAACRWACPPRPAGSRS